MRTRSEKTLEILEATKALLDPEQPMTLRHLYYLLLSNHVLEGGDAVASKRSYNRLKRIIAIARRKGEVPFEALVDNIRTTIKPSSWSGLTDFAEETTRLYRLDLWARQKDYMEIWVEKDAIAGVVGDITYEFDVNLRPMRGYSSLTFLHQAAQELSEITKPIFIYYFGDHDPSGHDIERACRDGLIEMFNLDGVGWPARGFSWLRLALDAADMNEFEIIPLPAKPKDTRYKKFKLKYGTDAAELEALPPDELRRRVQTAIDGHIDTKEWKKLQRVERLERASYQQVMKKLGDGSRRGRKK